LFISFYDFNYIIYKDLQLQDVGDFGEENVYQHYT